MKLFLARDLIDGTPRGAMTPARKRRIWEAHNGLCIECEEDVPMEGPEVQYDHEIPLALGGSDDDGNIGPMHTRPCHAVKTKRDVARIAKAKRQRKLIEEVEPSKRPIPQRENPWPEGRPFPKSNRKIPSRGFGKWRPA